MRKIVLISLTLFIGLNMYGQNPFINPGIFYMPAPGPEKYFADKNDATGMDSWAKYQLRTGMAFNSLNGYNSFNSWVSPSALLPVSSKFAVNIGVTYINSFYPGESEEMSRASDFIMNVSGIYLLNEKTTFYGSYSRSLMNDGLFGNDGFESITMGMEYMPFPNFRIGASISTTKGFHPGYMYPSYYSPYRYGPFY